MIPALDRRIDPDRQMRAMLFDGADRKDCHDAFRVDVGEVLVVSSHHQCDLRAHASSPALGRSRYGHAANPVRRLRMSMRAVSSKHFIRQARCLLATPTILKITHARSERCCIVAC